MHKEENLINLRRLHNSKSLLYQYMHFLHYTNFRALHRPRGFSCALATGAEALRCGEPEPLLTGEPLHPGMAEENRRLGLWRSSPARQPAISVWWCGSPAPRRGSRPTSSAGLSLPGRPSRPPVLPLPRAAEALSVCVVLRKKKASFVKMPSIV
jgi:hypothetical protein